MPVVKRSPTVGGEKKPAPRARDPVFELPDVTLPMDVSEVVDDIRQYSILMHGEKKIGKTTFMAQEDNAFFLEFDPLQKAVAIKQQHVPTWQHYLAYLDKLEKKNPYDTIVVDRADLMYLRCFTYMCQKMNIDHPTDLAYGKGWDAFRLEFQTGVHRLMVIAPTRWIAHSSWKEVDHGTIDEDGVYSTQKFERLGPEFPKQADGVLTGLMDITVAYVFRGQEPVMVIKGDETVVCGHRVDDHFVTPKGRIVREIPGGANAKEAYANFLKAFHNKQTFTTIAERDRVLAKKKEAQGD